MSGGARMVSYVGLGMLGVLVSVAGALLQGAWFPGGLLLALVGSAALFFGGAKLTGSRPGAMVPAAVWLITVLFLSSPRPEGDFLLTAGISQYAYLLGGSMAGVMSVMLIRPGPSEPRSSGARQAPGP